MERVQDWEHIHCMPEASPSLGLVGSSKSFRLTENFRTSRIRSSSEMKAEDAWSKARSRGAYSWNA